MNNYDYIKYGIGIGTSTKDIGFENLSFASGLNVSVTQGTVEQIKDPSVYKQYMFQTGNEYTSNPFFEKNKTEYTDAYVVRVPNSAADEIVHLDIRQIIPNVLGYVLVIVEAGAQVTLQETVVVQSYLGLTVDVIVEDDAQCYYAIQQNGSTDPNTFRIHTGSVQKDASLTWFDCISKGNIIKHSIITYLVGEGATAHTYGIFLGAEHTVHDLYTVTEHIASHTTSDMFVRGVLDDAATAVYRGLVKVHAGAYGCQGYQQEDTLLLSPQATVSSVPDLEISNNNVRCSHGVTTTHIDDIKLFYLRSRGLSRAAAEQQFVLGHIGAVLQKLPKSLQDNYTKQVQEILNI